MGFQLHVLGETKKLLDNNDEKKKSGEIGAQIEQQLKRKERKVVTTFSYTARAVKKKKKATTQLKEIDIRATRTLYANKCVSFWPRGVRRTTSTHADIHRENGKKKTRPKEERR